jgi:integrase
VPALLFWREIATATADSHSGLWCPNLNGAPGRAVLRTALSQAVRWEYVSRNVAKLVTVPRRVQVEVMPLSPDEARTLLEAVKGHRLEALISVAVAVGLRQGEALGLKWPDVDLTNGTLRIRQTLQRIKSRGLVLDDVKSARSRRTIALPEVTLQALRAHRRRQLEERLKAGEYWQDDGFVFASVIGTPIDPRNVVRQFHAMLTTAKLSRTKFHNLRHTSASLLLAQGVDVRTIMASLAIRRSA